MLIISKFRDYYDASVGSGIDKTIIYERVTSSVQSRDFILKEYIAGDYFYRASDWVWGSKVVVFEWSIIGFCGKTYVLLTEKTKDEDNAASPETIEYFYGDECLEKVFRNKKQKWRYQETRNFIDKWHGKEFLSFFVNNKVPIFIATRQRGYNQINSDVVLNPLLLEYKFFRIFDSYTAFQEIQMFISGVLGVGAANNLEIPNDEKIKQHGFDLKWSFRNPDPPKRKQ